MKKIIVGNGRLGCHVNVHRAPSEHHAIKALGWNKDDCTVHRTKKCLELFAGSRSFSKEAEKRGYETFSSDREPFDGIDYVTDIFDFDVTKVPFIPDVIWASPPCTFFSVASIGKHWHADHTPKTENAKLGVRIVEKTLEIIDFFMKLNPGLKFIIENPRGKLRKLDVVKGLPRTSVCYCQYGDMRMKPTDLWANFLRDITNVNGWEPRPMCHNGNKACHHEPAPRGSRTGTQGLKGNYERSKVPAELINEILDSLAVDVTIEEYRGYDYGED